MKNAGTSISWAFVSAALLTVGCGGGAPAAEGRPIELLVSVPTHSGTVVEFYEASPGVIVVSETAKAGVAPTLNRELLAMAPEALLGAIKPARMAVPAAFERAVQRHRELQQNGPTALQPVARARSSQEPGELWVDPVAAPAAAHNTQIRSSTKAVTKSTTTGYSKPGVPASWFRQYFCEIAGAEALWCDLYRSGNSSRTRSDVIYAAITVAPYYRDVFFSVSYRPWWSWGTYGTWRVKQGYWRFVSLLNGRFDFDVRSSVSKWHNCSIFDFACYSQVPDSKYHHAAFGDRW